MRLLLTLPAAAILAPGNVVKCQLVRQNHDLDVQRCVGARETLGLDKRVYILMMPER